MAYLFLSSLLLSREVLSCAIFWTKPWSQVSSLLPPRYVPSFIFISHRVRHSHYSSIFIEYGIAQKIYIYTRYLVYIMHLFEQIYLADERLKNLQLLLKKNSYKHVLAHDHYYYADGLYEKCSAQLRYTRTSSMSRTQIPRYQVHTRSIDNEHHTHTAR